MSLIKTSISFIPRKILFNGGVVIANPVLIRGIKLLEGDSTEKSSRDIN